MSNRKFTIIDITLFGWPLIRLRFVRMEHSHAWQFALLGIHFNALYEEESADDSADTTRPKKRKRVRRKPAVEK